jgi:hypothetical protein
MVRGSYIKSNYNPNWINKNVKYYHYERKDHYVTNAQNRVLKNRWRNEKRINYINNKEECNNKYNKYNDNYYEEGYDNYKKYDN